MVTHDVSTIKSRLHVLLQSKDKIVAAWEGGSVATGFADEYSDLDLLVIIEDKDTEPVFQLLQEHFSSLYGIERYYRLPEPAWHGMSQAFYLLKDCPSCFYCDIAVVPRSNPHKFTEPDRHGNAWIWFDKDRVFSAMPTPLEEQESLVQKVLGAVFAIDFLAIIELDKSLQRENWLASQMNWQLFINRCLVPLLNAKYRPAKVDFGIRYAEREYPPEIVKTLASLLHYNSVGEIRQHCKLALEIYQSLKQELSHTYGLKEQL